MERAFLLSLIGFLLLSAPAAAWQPASGPLRTRWAKAVTPETAHREYPRPQMVRQRWMSLNGVWQFSPAKEQEAPPAGRNLDGEILVPFPVESALSGVTQRHPRVWYRRTFTIPEDFRTHRLLLHFEAANWEARVYLNGRPLGSHRGGYDPFSFDISEALREGEQELVVGIFNPADAGHQPRGKQMNVPNNETFYTASTGLWQSVWLEPVPDLYIEDVEITPDVDGSSVRLRVHAAETRGMQVRAIVTSGGRPVAEKTGDAGAEMTIPIRDPVLWTPESPYLYDMKVVLQRDGKPLDTVDSYFGMRKVAIRSDGRFPRIMLNDRFVFQIGPLDQGYWPDGLYTAPTDEALRYDIEAAKRLGFNMIRKHVKVEPRRWYYWADRLGVLVWQDMPFSTNATPESKTQFAVELRRMIECRRGHPSIISWVVFNERFGQHDTEQLTAMVKRLDPTRVVNSASGGEDVGVGDVYDEHSYPAPNSRKSEGMRASVVGEFGGLGLVVPDHVWNDRQWSYHLYTNAADMTRRYEKLLNRAWRLKDEIGISGVVYTQITDVEAEINGLMTYDRAVLKMDEARVAAANRGEYVDRPLTMVVPTAETAPAEWRYKLTDPGPGWEAMKFDDSAWQAGRGGFGSAGTVGAIVNTPWSSEDIWLRHTFTLAGEPPKGLLLSVFHDEDVEVYLNGVLAMRAAGFTTDYTEFPIVPEALKALRPGRNTIAVYCRNTAGGQNIDAGLGYP